MKIRTAGSITFWLLLICQMVTAQSTTQTKSEPPQPLTSCDLYRLLDNGLSEQIILQTIRIHRAKSVPALALQNYLKKHGATDKIFDAMQEALPPGQESKDEFPCVEGYYYKAADNWVKLRFAENADSYSTGLLPKALLSGYTAGLVGPGRKCVYLGEQSQAKINEAMPVVYFVSGGNQDGMKDAFAPKNKFLIVKLNQKKDRREVVVDQGGWIGLLASGKYIGHKVVGTGVKPIATDVLSVTPKVPLVSGEHLLILKKPGIFSATGYGHDFSIVIPKK